MSALATTGNGGQVYAVVPVAWLDALSGRIAAVEAAVCKQRSRSTSRAVVAASDRHLKKQKIDPVVSREAEAEKEEEEQKKKSEGDTGPADIVLGTRELLMLVFTHLDLPAMRLLKATNKTFASSARRVFFSKEWLAYEVAGLKTNMDYLRKMFERKRGFALPLRVVLEKYTDGWTWKFGTLHYLRVRTVPVKGQEDRIVPVDMRLVVDGEGLHESPERISNAGYSRIHAGIDAPLWGDNKFGLGCIRPVLEELVPHCVSMGVEPVVGTTLFNLLRVKELKL